MKCTEQRAVEQVWSNHCIDNTVDDIIDQIYVVIRCIVLPGSLQFKPSWITWSGSVLKSEGVVECEIKIDLNEEIEKMNGSGNETVMVGTMIGVKVRRREISVIEIKGGGKWST